MDRADEYRQKAEEADRAAHRATSATERESYEAIARGWRDLVAEAERAKRRGY